jgi:hypothetical protein
MSSGREKKIQIGGQMNMERATRATLTPLAVQGSPPFHSSFR